MRETSRWAWGMVLALAFTASNAVAQTAPSKATSVYEHTTLKAKPGRRDALRRYIAANWFVMDQKGFEQGIFTSYWLLEDTETDGSWDYMMVVGYPQPLGYSDARTIAKFQAIRRAHDEIKIDGLGLGDLGSIVENRRVKRVG